MPSFKNLKQCLGFSNGYITIFPPFDESLEEWFRMSPARYATRWGWYFPSDRELPQLPAGVEPKQLKWEDISVNDETLKSDAAVADVVASIIYPPSNSAHIGKVGERLEKILTVKKNIPITDIYGTKTIHIFVDDNDNEYLWQTTAKSLPCGSAYLMRGTVKEHIVYKGSKQTVLTRCAVREEIKEVK